MKVKYEHIKTKNLLKSHNVTHFKMLRLKTREQQRFEDITQCVFRQ